MYPDLDEHLEAAYEDRYPDPTPDYEFEDFDEYDEGDVFDPYE